MATAEQLKALVRSFSSGDEGEFIAIASQIAAHSAKTGKTKLAGELKKIIADIKRDDYRSAARKPVPINRPAGELANLFHVAYPRTRVSEMVLHDTTRDKLRRVLEEYRQASTLQSHGLTPRRKLLLVGPPGCGKTMTATALAGELKLPLMSIQLHTVITKFMGETAAKLHLIFQAMVDVRAVYFFDEFDAIGARRDGQNDVGEIRRVLNSFLQFLERDESQSLVIAATNLEDLLDTALFRRFDDVLEYDTPNDAMIRMLVENRLSLFTSAKIDWKSVIETARDQSHAEIVRACEDAAKDAVLGGGKKISTAMLVNALGNRPGFSVDR